MAELKNRFKFSLIPNTYSIGNRRFSPGFTITMYDDNLECGFFNSRPAIFKKTLLTRVSVPTPGKESSEKKETIPDILTSEDLMNVKLSSIEGLDKKLLSKLSKGKVKTLSNIYIEGFDSDNVLDLVKIKGIGESTEEKIIEITDAFVKEHLPSKTE